MILVKIFLALAILIIFGAFVIPYWRDQWIYYRVAKITRKNQKRFAPGSEDYQLHQNVLNEVARMRKESHMGDWIEW